MSFIDKGHGVAAERKYNALHYVIVFLMVAFFVFLADRLYAATTLSTNVVTDGKVMASSTLEVTSSSTLYSNLRLGGYLAPLNYNIVANAGGTAASQSLINTDNDFFVEGSFEADGLSYFDGGLITGASSTVGGAFTTTGYTTLAKLVSADTSGNLNASGTVHSGGVQGLAYNAISDAGGTASHTSVSGGFIVDSDDDLYMEGVLEVDGGLWLDNNATSTAGGLHFEDSIAASFGTNNDATVLFNGTDLVFTSGLNTGEAIFASGTMARASSTVMGALTTTGRVNVGGVNYLAYNAISDAGGTASHTSVSGGFIVDSDDDLYMEGVLEVDGGLWLDNNATSTAGGLHFEDDIRAWFGTNNDGSIRHDGTDLWITPGINTGNVVFTSGTIAHASSTVMGNFTVGDDFFVSSSGKTGVNTTTPTNQLNVFSTGTSTVKIESQSALQGGCLAIEMSTSTAGHGFVYCIAQTNGNLTCSTTRCDFNL